MNSKLWIQKAFAACVLITLTVTYTVSARANTAGPLGELVVSENSVNGTTPAVTVNGEAAKSGRSIFSSSSISVAEDASAIVEMGAAGAIELMPGTNVVISFDDSSASVDLTAGTLKVLRSGQPMKVNVAGTTNKVSAGESSSAGAPKPNPVGGLPVVAVVVAVGIVAAIVIAVVVNGNGNKDVVSPTR